MRLRRWAALALLAMALDGGPAMTQPVPDSTLATAQKDRLRTLLGRPVYSADGVRFGDVQGLALDRHDGRVLGAVVQYGGFLGAFASEVLVPAEQIAVVNTDSLVLLWTAAEMESAPRIDAGQVAESAEIVQVE